MYETRILATLARGAVSARRWRAALLGCGEVAGALRACASQPLPRQEIDADLAWIEARGAHLVHCGAAQYPPRLAAIPGAPAVLYVLGSLDCLGCRQVAMVGSRNPTAGGSATAAEFAARFAAAGVAVTSGLALGIDAAGHAAALGAQGPTVAVCATGLDQVYPRQNERLAAAIVAGGGALVSELPPRTPPRRNHFPQRNRLISGLALGVLVVEAAPGSGSLRTAAHARAQGRPVFAIPGSIRNPLARGCHLLIRGGARLVEDADEVLGYLDISNEKQRVVRGAAEPRAAVALDKACEFLLDAVGFDPTSFDVLVERTGFSAERVASMLLMLELNGRIEPHPGGRYGRAQQARG